MVTLLKQQPCFWNRYLDEKKIQLKWICIAQINASCDWNFSMYNLISNLTFLKWKITKRPATEFCFIEGPFKWQQLLVKHTSEKKILFICWIGAINCRTQSRCSNVSVTHLLCAMLPQGCKMSCLCFKFLTNSLSCTLTHYNCIHHCIVSLNSLEYDLRFSCL